MKWEIGQGSRRLGLVNQQWLFYLSSYQNTLCCWHFSPPASTFWISQAVLKSMLMATIHSPALARQWLSTTSFEIIDIKALLHKNYTEWQTHSSEMISEGQMSISAAEEVPKAPFCTAGANGLLLPTHRHLSCCNGALSVQKYKRHIQPQGRRTCGQALAIRREEN